MGKYFIYEPKGKLFIIAGFQIVHVLSWIIFNSYYFILYSLNNPSIEKYKVEKVSYYQDLDTLALAKRSKRMEELKKQDIF